ncbi:hypothetical protein [Campylobacter molothri]|uniref:pentapeptide repeat-containing protein n=1 Tax=Campylobacter molothri TaxID=1032242 RepID=UPI001EBAA176|nr:hypothetical protein [Campylobacter sp. RM10535]
MEELTKEQAIIDIAENLGISKEYVNFDENKEIYTIKDNNNLKKIHIKKFNCKLYEQYNLSFKKCVFECEIKDTRGLSLNIGNKIFFLKCDFENKIIFFNLYFKNISFILCNFKNETTFQACTFKTFCNFESSVFEHFISFDQSTFLDKVSFYNTYFYKLPNFSRVTFKGDLIATNINLNFDFDELESKIRKGDINFIEYRIKQDEKSLDKFANDFRDSFRIFKNALIKDNNLLDASNFHKYELYCKEIELKQSWDKKDKNVENMTDLEKNISRIRDFVDFLLLGFYRKLCDHHTDFLRVFNNLILLIALYVLFIFIGGFEFNVEKKSKDLDKLSNIFSFFIEAKQKILNFSFIQQYYGYILIIFCIICLIFIIVTLCKILKDIELGFIKNIIFKDGLKSLWNLCAYVFALLVILLYINIFIPKSQNNLTILSNIGIFFAFCIFYLWIVYLNSLFFRYILIVFSYIVTIFAMGKNIFILNPLIGKLVYDKISFDNPLFIHLTFAYTILMALVLFSLQKTARKNSIVPS